MATSSSSSSIETRDAGISIIFYKAVTDGMQGVVYKNDSSIRAMNAWIASDGSPKPRVEVSISLL